MTEISKSISIAPLIAGNLFYVIVAALLALLLLAIFRRKAGLVRIILTLGFLLYVMNPVSVEKQETPAGDVALILVDDSMSQKSTGRDEIAANIENLLSEKLAAISGLSVVKKNLSEIAGDADKETRLKEAISKAMAEIPADRNAGAIVITDGRIHDMPEDGSAGVESDKPVHFLVTEKPNEKDLWLEVKSQQKFGFVGETAKAELVLHADGAALKSPRTITITTDEGGSETLTAVPEEPFEVELSLAHRGKNSARVDAAREDGELSKTNNSVLLTASASRDRMKVLLVTGKIYEGQRVWRNFLKSDPSVDLVHFNILRNLQDREFAASNELSLIPFPVDELFGPKLPSFDLIIIDQFPESPTISEFYLSNIANYVRNGGSLLFVSGPVEDATSLMLSREFSETLPVIFSGSASEGAFLPAVTALGAETPLTKPLAQMAAKGKKWGKWYRIADSAPRSGAEILMAGPAMKPLLVVQEVEKGRAAALTSDQIWLWSRKHDDGGPYNVLAPNIIHWLLHEPELEEKILSVKSSEDTIAIHLNMRSGKAQPAPQVTMPAGIVTMPEMKEGKSGNLVGEIKATQKGVYSVVSGDKVEFISNIPDDSKEYYGLTASVTAAQKIADATGGSVEETGGKVSEIRMVKGRSSTHGSGWMGLVSNNRKIVSGVKTEPLVPAHLFLIILLSSMLGVWWRESGKGRK